MNVASRELCEELYKLSGWKSSHHFHQDGGVYECNNKPDSNISAYDAGFLLRKLPKGIQEDESYYLARFFLEPSTDYWQAGYRRGAASPDISSIEKEPEDALAKLAIELFKSGVLKKGIGDE